MKELVEILLTGTLLRTCVHNSRQDSTAVPFEMQIWCDVNMRCIVCVGEHASIALIPEVVFEAIPGDLVVPLANFVACFFTNELSNIGTYVPAA